MENLFAVECETLDDLMAVLEEGERYLLFTPSQCDSVLLDFQQSLFYTLYADYDDNKLKFEMKFAV